MSQPMPNGFSCLSPKNGYTGHVWLQGHATSMLFNKIVESFRIRDAWVAYVCGRCGYATGYRFMKGPKR